MLISDKCRLCLAEVNDYNIIPLFNNFADIELCTQIFQLTGVRVCEDDSLPSNICKLCFSQLENFEKFKHEVQRSDCILRQQLESCEKTDEASNINPELEAHSGDYAFDSEHCINKYGLSIVTQSGSIDIQSYREKVLTLMAVHKEDSRCDVDGNIVPMDMTNNSQKDMLDPMEGKEKEEISQVTLCDLGADEKDSLNNEKNRLEDNRERNNYSVLQNSSISGSDDADEYTMNSETHEENEEKISCKPLQCEICQKIFKSNTTLRRHQVVHTGHEYHKCVECHKIFAHKHNLVKHFRIHSGVRLTCTICQKMFTQPEYLKNHMMYTHSEGDPLSCNICGRMYKNSVTLMMHKKTLHDGTNKAVCTVCGKLLGSNALSKHMKTHIVSERIKCDLCDRSYKNRYIMLEHRKSHLKVPASCCDICGKTFKTNGILKNHKLTHSTEKQFCCSMCGAKFTQGAALRTHQRVHTGVEPYTCPCGEKFRWKKTFDKHTFKCTQRSIAVY